LRVVPFNHKFGNGDDIMDIFYITSLLIALFVVLTAMVLSTILIGLFLNSLFKFFNQKKAVA